MYTCPVCFYDRLTDPPQDYNICDCCGTEFENDDVDTSHPELRDRWMMAGAPWFYGNAPVGWNPWRQLLRSYVSTLPYRSTLLSTSDDGPTSYTSLLADDFDILACQEQDCQMAMAG